MTVAYVDGNLESLIRKVLLLLSSIREIFAYTIRNPESCALESGIQFKESRNPLTIGIRNPSSSDKESEFSTWNQESTSWNRESKTALDTLTGGDT